MDIVSELTSWWYVVAIWLFVLVLIPRLGRVGQHDVNDQTPERIRPLLLKLFLDWNSTSPITLRDIASYLNLMAPKAPIIATLGAGFWFPLEIYWDESNSAVLLDRLKIDLTDVNEEIQNRLRNSIPVGHSRYS